MVNNQERAHSDLISYYNQDTLYAQNIYRFEVETAGRIIPFSTRDLLCFIRNPERGTTTFVSRNPVTPSFFTFTSSNINLVRVMRETHPLIAETNKILKNDKS